ncbi:MULTISPECIES: hypothetical protein [Vibrio]|uniref:hypothetical protein n=1 Tax=Vibrio TaxID=662 RepID=UPI001B30F9FC|nr:hypothetical protein [Vibrio crassostreae]CAK1713466.1 conserved hypothetical protein [Vibrio crassostreae]CAK1721067.1 conserved hypothetical protein [Vibrio crassostreae]CAK1722303.1 conserved hypothetical protein [Vibrio crassostreae]CAK1723416.1 conserved hypothetical protein [Vibrio crassostreae]CAK2394465.1 conserved hypothetical protein [Vibrio crassostreae]
MMLSLTNPEIASADNGVLNVEANHDKQTKSIYDSNRKATFLLSTHVELLDLSINRFMRYQAMPHNESGGSRSILSRFAFVHIIFLAANGTIVSSRALTLYFAPNFLYSYPLFLIKPKAASKLEISISNVDATVVLHSSLLVKSEEE